MGVREDILKMMNPDKDSDYLEIHETDLDITRKVPLYAPFNDQFGRRNYASILVQTRATDKPCLGLASLSLLSKLFLPFLLPSQKQMETN